jgi:pimeloyl-ACP methyl ester carboxylesterase
MRGTACTTQRSLESFFFLNAMQEGAASHSAGWSTAAARAFWREFAAHDWWAELAAMSCPSLVYVGGVDRQFASAVRRTRRWLVDHGTTVWELDGLDHRGCDDEPHVSTLVVPTVTAWLDTVQRRGWTSDSRAHIDVRGAARRVARPVKGGGPRRPPAG